MTHEELLAKIDKWYDYARGSISQVHSEFCISSDGCNCDKYDSVTDEVYKALRAVVELHREDTGTPGEDILCDWCKWIYPCPTIQAIEKELEKPSEEEWREKGVWGLDGVTGMQATMGKQRPGLKLPKLPVFKRKNYK